MKPSAYSPRQRQMLREIADGRIHERFRNGWATAQALQRRGLVRCAWIGMGWFQVAITKAGRTVAEGFSEEGA